MQKENLYIYNVSMSNAGAGARIKVYPGNVPGDNCTSCGGGTGVVRNVTYNGMHDTGVDCKSSYLLSSFNQLLM
jgi:galacturan 1,4-alpha-galacturonidase